ncbi:MAG: hypothetical protein M1823_009070, partial [Watsoniomyces obsoletus]
MLAEDVIAALNEMGLCELKPQKRKKKTSTEANGSAGAPEKDDVEPATMSISRLRVLDWAEANSVEIVSPVKEEGFLGEWALSDVDGEQDDDQEDLDDVAS